MKSKFNSFPFLVAILFALLLLFFRLPVSHLLDFILVRPLLSGFEGGVWEDAIFLILVLFAFGWLAVVQHLKILARLLALGLILYAFQKSNSYWSFKPMLVIPKVFYWDAIAIGSVFSLLICWLLTFVKKFEKQKVQETDVDKGFIEDSVVMSYEDDHFKRKIAAAEIATLISETPNKRSFAIGILGQYGSGKTSFLNLINLALEDKDALKIEFNPWSAANPDMIRREFFDLLANRVALLDRKVSSLMYAYGRKLASFDGRSLSWFNWIGFFRNQVSVQSSGEYEQINKMLGETGKKIVVSIDDLDRLYPAEISEVLKLIRNTANFSNVIYLVGYDREYVLSALRTLNASSEDFLDKIFQLEIPLPKREQDDLLVTLKNRLKKMVTAEHFGAFEDMMIPNFFLSRYEEAYRGVLRQGRDVVRFLNNFKIAYKLIGEEVDFKSLVLLELIKFRFPAVYDMLYTQWDSFLYETALRATHEQFFQPRIAQKKDFTNNKEEISVFRTHLEKLGKWTEQDVALLDGLFMTLFNGSQFFGPERKNSISYPLYFEVYFRYRLSQTDLSDREYQAAKTGWKMGEYMHYCASNNLHKELMTRLMQEDISKDRQTFEQVIGWIFSFGKTFVGKEGKFRFDFQSLVDKIYNYHNVITDKLYKKNIDDYKNFIKGLLEAARPPYLFENELIYKLKEKWDDFVLTADELTEYQLQYFSRYAESDHGLNEDVLWIFWGARKYHRIPIETGGYNVRWEFEPKLAEKMKGYLTRKNPKEFLKFSVERNLYDRSQTSIHQHILQMFDDPADYRKIVADNKILESDIKDEYLELFDKLSEKNFIEFVEMEFKSELYKRDKE